MVFRAALYISDDAEREKAINAFSSKHGCICRVYGNLFKIITTGDRDNMLLFLDAISEFGDFEFVVTKRSF